MRPPYHQVKILTVGADAHIGPKPTDGTDKCNGSSSIPGPSGPMKGIGPYERIENLS